MLKIYNTFTRKKEVFKPIKPGKIDIYVCGMTVYDYCHIGHARLLVVFDMIVRYLRWVGFDVTYVRNITDIDDKIIKRAQENHEEVTELVERFIKIMHEDEETLFILPPNIEPRATKHIAQIIQMIQTLLKHEYAYVAENGDVYYNARKFRHYGKLAHQNLDALEAGARVEVTDVKRDSLDFVLWKLSKPGEPKWNSPWGEGRPGWHIECSTMSTHYLGKHFDIHGGGLDLQFPHHENEIAQSEAANECKFVNVWIHLGYVQVDKEKMSKSLGNFFTIREVEEKYDPESIRYFLIASHYRSPLSYSTDNLDNAHEALERFYLTLRDLPDAKPAVKTEFEKRFKAVMNDDFNTPEALAVLFDLTREINRLRTQNKLKAAAQLGALLKYLGGVLGILQQNPEQFLQGQVSHENSEKIKRLIAARNKARETKNWAEADRIRHELIAMDIELEDEGNRTIWRKR